MARSLQVQHEESPRTSMLFVSFVVLSACVLLFTWFSGDAAEIEPPVPAAKAAAID